MKIALTFDAEFPAREHRSPDAPWEILTALAARSVRATFFIQGWFANAEPALARRIAQDGHLIGNHSHHHAPMTYLDQANGAFLLDVHGAELAIEKASGVSPRPFFRYPFGPAFRDESTDRLLGEAGYIPIGWDVDPGDVALGTTPDEIAGRVISGIREVGPVVLMHTWPRTTAEALPRLLDALSDHEFVGLDDLFAGSEP